MRYPAAVPALGLGVGVTAGIFLHVASPPAVLILLWLAAAIALRLRRDEIAVTALALGFVACGSVLGTGADSASRATSLRAVFDDSLGPDEHQLFALVGGRLRSDAVRGPAGVALDLRVDTVEVDRRSHAVKGGALISVGGALSADRILQWRAGRRVAFPATLRRPARYLNRGVPDSERQLAWRGAPLVGSVKSDRLVEVVAHGTTVAELLAAVRSFVRSAIARTVAPWSARSAAVVAAILIGDRAGLDEDAERTLQEAGTYHVIAISGGNIAILAGLCLFTLRAARAGPRVSALIVIGVLAAYGLVVAGSPSVMRAMAMAIVYLTTQIWDHRARPANVIALVAALVFCVAPLQSVDAGFALTFAATLAIVIGLSKFGGHTRRWWLQPLTTILAASIFAEVALLPISAFVFSRVTFAGLVVNFAAIPMMTVVQIAGMAAVMLSSLAPDAAAWSGRIAHWGVEGLIGSAALVDLVPVLSQRVPPPSLVVVSGYYVALIAALVSRRVVTIAAFAGFATWIVAAPAPQLFQPQQSLRVTFLDVGQGDAAVVRFPNGRTLSIDAGGLPGGTFDIGSRVVSPAFWAAGVRRLDYMSITHGDDDHIGGAASVFRDFRPMEVWEGVPVPPHKPTRELRQLAADRGATWRTLQVDDRVDFGEVELTVHHPPRPDWERQRVRNNDSEVIELRYGGVSLVFTGDIGREAEQAIASSFAKVPIRILKVPHHGSATSSSPNFVAALAPDIAVISAGRGNTFGHPVPVVLERYQRIGAAIFRTDQDGAVFVETDGKVVRVRTFMGRTLTLSTRGR